MAHIYLVPLKGQIIAHLALYCDSIGAYLPSDPHLAGPTSIYVVKPVDQQGHSKNQHFQLHTYYHTNFVFNKADLMKITIVIAYYCSNISYIQKVRGMQQLWYDF